MKDQDGVVAALEEKTKLLAGQLDETQKALSEETSSIGTGYYIGGSFLLGLIVGAFAARR